MAKGVDGIGLAALGLGSALMFAGIKGYSFLAVLENLVTGKPIHMNVNMTQPLTTNEPVVTPGSSGETPSGLINPPIIERR